MSRQAAAVWLRGARRQPARALVVVLTIALMTLGAAGSLAAGDSLERLFVADAHAEWGEVDVEVTSAEDGAIALPLARLVAVNSIEGLSGHAPRLILSAVVSHDGRDEPDALVMGLGAEEQTFSPLEAVDGSADVLRLRPDEVIVNERLAHRLDVAVGDPISLVVAVHRSIERNASGGIADVREARAVPLDVTVAGIVENRHVADLHRTPNVLLRRDVLQRAVDFGPFVNVLHLAAADDTPAGTERLLRTIESDVRSFDLESDDVLLDQLAIAEDEGGQFQAILFTLALLVIAAAGIATVQLVTGHAEDRSGEIAVLRTLGVGRRTIMRLVAIETGILAVAGGALGLVGAIPLARVLARALSDHFATLAAGRGREQVALPTDIDIGVLATGLLIVLVVAMLAGRAAGRRLAGVELDTLLRGPVEQIPGEPLRPRRPTVLLVAGAAMFGMGIAGGPASDALRYMGLTLVGLSWWTHARRRAVGLQRVDDLFALGALVWATVGAGLLADFSQGFETGFGILVAAGVLSVAATATLLSRRFRLVFRQLRAWVPRGAWQVALRTAGAWAEAAAGRTGRLHATFGVVLFVAAALHVLGNAMMIPAERQAGGLDVIATSVAGVDPLRVAELAAADAVAAVPSVLVPEDAYGSRASEADPILRLRYPVRLAAASPELVDVQSFGLAEALPEYRTAAEALAAVVRDVDKAVVDRYGLPPGARVGDEIVLDLGPSLRRFELVAVLDTFLLDTVFVNRAEYHDLAASVGANLVLARAAEGVAPDELATAMEEAHRGRGLDAETVDQVAADVVSVNRTFTDVFALILLLGLAVAVVAVAAALVRSTRQRRPALAVLRLIGLPRWALVVTVVAEPLVVALTGGVFGLLVGLAVLRALFAVGFSQLAFVVDVGTLVTALGLLTVLLIVVCLLAAWPARHVTPTVAVD
ncbi:MAG: FtsX-like permease family protein [Nitriliruptorales bacterium]|nr:FtsX-like permease family protein [Nitriliruptorales bacterium]